MPHDMGNDCSTQMTFLHSLALAKTTDRERRGLVDRECGAGGKSSSPVSLDEKHCASCDFSGDANHGADFPAVGRIVDARTRVPGFNGDLRVS